MDVLLGLKTYAAQVDSRLGDLLPRPDPLTPLHEAMRYSALAPGKRLRPALCMEASRALGADPAIALDAACAIELVHAFSLIHDDLPALDNDDLRRGRPTCHIRYGEATALLAGDALFALAFSVLATTGSAQAVKMLADASLDLVRGETLDLLSEGQAPEVSKVETIHRNKTGALLAAACGIGGCVGGGTPEQTQALWRFGMEVGLAFQIADDILNETATAEQLGKAGGSDKERGKQTYPAALGILGARKAAEHHVETAIESLHQLPGPTEVLIAFARFSIDRQH